MENERKKRENREIQEIIIEEDNAQVNSNIIENENWDSQSDKLSDMCNPLNKKANTNAYRMYDGNHTAHTQTRSYPAHMGDWNTVSQYRKYIR